MPNRSHRRRFYFAIGTVLLLLPRTGCWDYYAVKSTLVVVAATEGYPPQITETESYRSTIKRVNHIAVMAPDGCLDETSTQSKGEARATKSVLLKSTCGQEMSILERTLAESGYRVFSWSVVNSRSQSENRAPLDIARDMGADILLQINSMERLTLEKSIDLNWERRFFLSNRHWQIGRPIDVDAYTRDQIVRHAKRVETQIADTYPGVGLSVTVISVETGEAVWFYERTLSTGFERKDYENTSFFACSLKNGLCKPWPPRHQRAVDHPFDRTYSSRVVESETRLAHTDQRAVYFELLKRLIHEMVGELKASPSNGGK